MTHDHERLSVDYYSAMHCFWKGIKLFVLSLTVLSQHGYQLEDTTIEQ